MPQLKEFLRNRGLKTTGTKNELAALAFGAEQLSAPVKLAAEEEIIQNKSNTRVFSTSMMSSYQICSRNSKITGSVKRVFYRCNP